MNKYPLNTGTSLRFGNFLRKKVTSHAPTMRGRIALTLGLLFTLFSVSIHATEIYVSPKGNNKNDGSALKPLQTVDAALRKARELRRLKDPSVKDGIQIILKGGTYSL